MAVASTLCSMACLFWVTRRRKGLADYTPPVTIFKPLKGIDEGLEENLRSFFQLDYPVYQLLFGVADADDPAIEVVQQLLRRVSRATTPSSSSAARPSGSIPKVENLAAMDRHRKHDTILISDSNVRVRPSYLRETACYLAEPGVGPGDATSSPGWARRRPGPSWRTSSSTASSPAAWPRRRCCGSPAWSASRC